MPPPFKYFGPCPAHEHSPARSCKHCEALAARARKAKQSGNAPYKAQGIPIYRELHWPAPGHV